MGFSYWLRQRSEHYLLVDAQRSMAEKYGRPPPPRPRGWRDRFWLGVFAPAYRRLPWKLRRFTIQMMPGSHRQTWSPPVRRGISAVDAHGRVQAMSRPQPQVQPPIRPETRGE